MANVRRTRISTICHYFILISNILYILISNFILMVGADFYAFYAFVTKQFFKNFKPNDAEYKEDNFINSNSSLMIKGYLSNLQ